MKLARLGPPIYVAIEAAPDRVLPPVVAGACWGCSLPKHGCRKLTRCDARARRGRLTCGAHRRLEAAAQKRSAQRWMQMVMGW